MKDDIISFDESKQENVENVEKSIEKSVEKVEVVKPSKPATSVTSGTLGTLDISDTSVDRQKQENTEFKPGVGVDVGTSNIVVSRQTKDGRFVNRYHRNILYPMEVSEESSDLLERSDYLYIQVDDQYFIVGEDALRLVNAIGKGEVIRPMRDGILNPNLKSSTDLLLHIIKAVVGDPVIENETLRFSVPANPVDQDIDNLFHQMVLKNYFKKLGYKPESINEAMCVVYDCNPTMIDEDDNSVPMTGIGTSCGAGMWNIALSLKGLSLTSFSCTKSGDHLDEQVSKATGLPVSKVVRIKEKKLDLENIDMTNNVIAALSIYYDEMIERMIYHITKEFKKNQSELDGSIEIVVAGGTSMAPGFINRLISAISENNLPFEIREVRHSKNPFYSVAQGACVRAQADFAKSKNK